MKKTLIISGLIVGLLAASGCSGIGGDKMEKENTDTTKETTAVQKVVKPNGGKKVVQAVMRVK